MVRFAGDLVHASVLTMMANLVRYSCSLIDPRACCRVRDAQGPMYEFFPGSGGQDFLQGNVINAPLNPLWKGRDDQRPAVHGTRSQKSKAKESESRSGRISYREVRIAYHAWILACCSVIEDINWITLKEICAPCSPFSFVLVDHLG